MDLADLIIATNAGRRKKNKNEKEDLADQIINNSYLDTTTVTRKIDDLAPIKSVVKEQGDIAPTKSTTKKQKEEDNTWFSKGAFSDGYQIGDITKSILGTAGDIGVGAAKGIFRIGEGLGDLASYGVAGVADLLGNDDYADRVRKNSAISVTDKVFKPVEDFLDPLSVIGEKGDSISEGLGYVGAIMATGGLGSAAGLGTLGTTALTTGLTGLSSMGSGMGEAYQGGATDKEALMYGVISGVAEAGTELLFGGLGKAVNAVGLSKGLSSLDDALAKKISSKLTSTLSKNLAEYTVKAGAEGVEEVISGVLQGFGKKMTYMSEEDLVQIMKDEKLLDQFISGAVVSGIAQTPGLVKTTNAGRDFISNYTQNEQKVVDAEVEARVNEQQQAKGTELTNKEISKIREQVEKDFEKGYVSTDTIEKTLGKKLTAEQEAEIEAQLGSLLQQGKTATDPKQIAQLDQQMDELATQLQNSRSVDFSNDEYIQKSYQEKALRSQNYTADVTKYETKQQKIIQKAIDSGILNDTRKTHEFVDMLAKIAADKDINFDFANNEKLKASGFAVEGKTIDGFVNKDGITLNIDSNKTLNKIVGHEITHILEGTELYTELQKVVKEYATMKGVWNNRLEEITDRYKNIEGANVENELTSDLVGEYLFTDEDFVNNLSATKPNVFKKIYDEIKYLLKVATAGSEEARQLEKVKRTFEKAYKAQGTQTSTDTKYSVSKVKTDNQGRTLTKEQQEYFKDSKVRDKNGNLQIVYHSTPNAFTVFDKSKLGDNTLYSNTAYGHFVTSNKAFSERFTDIDNEGKKGNTMELYSKTENPIVHPYKSAIKYGEAQASKITEDYLKATGNEEVIEELQSAVDEGDATSIYDAYMQLVQFEDPFEYAAEERKALEQAGYDAIEIIEGYESELVEGSKSNEAVSSYAIFNSNQIKNVDNTNPTTNPDIRYSLSEDTDIDAKINSSMTMEEAKDMIQRAFMLNNIYNWYDGEYKNGDEWLSGVGADEVAMYIENTYQLQEKYLNKIYDKDIGFGDDFLLESVVEAYQNGTLKGSEKQIAQRLDVSKEIDYQDNRFYAPKEIQAGKELYEVANQRVTNANRQEVYKARANFIIAAHNKGFAEAIGLTQEEVSKKLKSWANYTKKAMDLSNSLNDGVASQNRWSGIENSSIVNTMSVSNEEMGKMVKEIKGDSSGWQRQYITSTMLALDTHIDYSNLTFEFEAGQKMSKDALGQYFQDEETIRISRAGQNTVAHEIGHYLDHKWAEDLGFAGKSLTDKYLKTDHLNAEQKQFVENFKLFVEDIENSSYLGSEYGRNNDYWQRSNEVFARFVGKFTEWVKNQATNNRYGYEDKWYKDNFTERQYREFVKILQEKSMLDVTDKKFKNDLRATINAMKENYSLSAENEEIAPTGNWNVRGEDIRLEIEEAIAPLQETIADLTEQVKTMQESFAPTSQDIVEQQRQENFAHLPESEMPTEIDETEFAPIEDTYEDVSSPVQERDIDEVGNRKVKAYQYEHPEVRPYFQVEADNMLGELQRRIEGERFQITGEDGYPIEWAGVTRQIPEFAEYLKDNYNYTYEQIEKGLKAIIEDNGAENNAVSKRLEILLDERLTNGYVDFLEGYPIPPNQEYKNMLIENDAADYYSNLAKTLDDADFPVENTQIEETTKDMPMYEKIKPLQSPTTRGNTVSQQTTSIKVKTAQNGNTDVTEAKQRKWVKTSTESEVVNREILPDDLDQSKIYYQPITNKATLGTANLKLDSLGYEKAVEYFNNQILNKTVKVEDIVLGERLIQEAIKNKDTKTAGELIQNVAILGTELGQKVQALSIIQRMTPEGQLKMLEKTINRGKAKGDKSFTDVEVTDDMRKKILDTYNEDGSYNKEALDKAVEDVKQEIADQMTPTLMDKINDWRYFSMLGNPKTHIRNLVSNVAMKGTMAVKNAVARTIESIAPIENRTKTWKTTSQEIKDYAQQTALEMKDVISGDSKYSETADIKSKRKTFNSNFMNWLTGTNSNILEVEDWLFSKSAFKDSLSEFLTANGIETKQDIEANPELVEKGKQYALEQSQIATFRQYSWLSNKIREIENKNAATQIAVGAVLPFKKTPINIAKTGLSYSPLGALKSLTYDLYQVGKGKMEASQAIDNIAQGATGTALTLIGYMLAQAGLINGAGDDDKESKYDYQLGKQAYSLNIDGKTYSISWLSPVAMPLLVGANFYEQLIEKEEWNADVVLETLGQTLDPLSEMSFLSSFTDVLSSYEQGDMRKLFSMFEAAGKNYATQFIPTLSSQVAATMDDTKRTTKVSGDSTFKVGEELYNQIIYKIPGLRETLEPSTDIWGNEIKQSESLLTRAFENFIAPYARKDSIATEIDEELKDLYSQTGDNGILPNIPYNYVNYDGEKYKMSAEEYTDYKKIYGQTANDLLEDLFRTTTYQRATSEERTDMVNDVYDYARDEANLDYLAKEGVNYTNTTEEKVDVYKENLIKGAVENDMTTKEYGLYLDDPEEYEFLKEKDYEYRQQYFDTYDSLKKLDESFEERKEGINDDDELDALYSEKKAGIVDNLINSGLDDTEKANLYKKYYNSDTVDTVMKSAINLDDYLIYTTKEFKADKNAKGNSIPGSRKEKVEDYVFSINGLNTAQRAILIKSTNTFKYNDYNTQIVRYLDGLGLEYEDFVSVLEDLDMTVKDGYVYWE